MRGPFLAIVALSVALGSVRNARADPVEDASGDPLTISLLVFGPGDHPFSKFGHAGLLLENRTTGASDVYNYGTFAFDSIALVPKFLLGKYRYWLSVQNLDRTLATYAAENRSVVAERLRLSPAQKRSIAAYLAWNARDENKYYVFDYYQDNCATRIRDLVDRTTSGAIARASTAPAEMTWRQHTLRLTADDLPVFLGLDVAMGSFIDRPITEWEEMFLPAKLSQGIARAGLVDRETVLVHDRRAPVRDRPPSWTGRALLAGAVIGLALAMLGMAAARSARARVALGLALAALGLAFGLLGSLFVFLWVVTNHQVAHHNENILACGPFALVLIAPAIGIVRGNPRDRVRVLRLTLAGLAFAAIGLTLKILPFFSQDNWLVLAFALPLWAGAAAACHERAGTRASLRP